VIQWTMIKVYS